MADKTYTLDRIVDLLQVPSDRREACLREIMIGLEFAEFAEASLNGPITWTDDEKGEFALIDPADGSRWLTLRMRGEVA